MTQQSQATREDAVSLAPKLRQFGESLTEKERSVLRVIVLKGIGKESEVKGFEYYDYEWYLAPDYSWWYY